MKYRSATASVPRMLAGIAIASLALGSSLRANEAPSEKVAEQETAATTQTADEPLPDDVDWSAVVNPFDHPYTPPPRARAVAPRDTGTAPAWSRNDRPNGTAAVTVKQGVSSFWDIKAGADLDVATQTSPLRTPETLPDKLASDGWIETSQGSAWMSARAPGVPYLSDHVALEARMNPHDAKLGTGFSKALPLHGDEVSLTLRHGYSIIQHDAIPGLPAMAAHARSYEMDRSAQVSFAESGTSLMAGQTLAPEGDRWLNSIGAQQKLFGGISITGSVSETREGFANRSLTAGFKKSW
jgi:hypothetical protein